MSKTYKFFAPTAKGLEPLLARELTGLGLGSVKEARAGVSFEGPLEAGYRACLWSRVANRVLLPLGQVPAATPEKLYGGVKSIRWSDHVKASGTIAVDFSSSQSQITHTHFGALKVKDAVCDQLRSVQGIRPSVDPGRPDVRINVYVHKDEATISVDLSGESLHKRSYREESVAAPLKENLAAGILLLADWPARAEAGTALLDPMCGSGTIPIEAAWMAAKVAPGALRSYHGFLGWLGHDPQLWKRLLEEANDLRVRDRKKIPPIVGYDQDFRAVRTAIGNIERAGMTGVVHVEKREFAAIEPVRTRLRVEGAPEGLIVMNPPYGERLGEVEELKPLYKQMSDVFKQRFAGWEAYVLTNSPDLMKAIRLEPARKHVVFNGALECRLLKYELFGGSNRPKRKLVGAAGGGNGGAEGDGDGQASRTT